MSVEHVLLFLVIGVFAGFFAGKIMKGSGFGIVGDLVLGILGSFVGVWIFDVTGIGGGSVLALLLAAAGGAVLLLYLIRSTKTA